MVEFRYQRISISLSLVFVLVSILCSIHAARLTEGKSMCRDGYYGYNCRHHCHCSNSSHCDVTANCRGTCADGWNGPTCQSHNIAFGKPTAIRTLSNDISSRSSVDGNASTCVTSDPGSRGWLRVDLQVTSAVYYLSIVTNGSSPRGWLVYVTEFGDYSDIYWAFPCATVRSDADDVHMSCDSPTSGRFLTVLNPEGPVDVCELRVHMCADYTFGPTCDMTCQCADASEVCHALTGHCRTGCRPGVTGRDCQQPCHKSYGNNCATPCGHCWRGVACDVITGKCPGECKPGWTGTHCNITCSPGHYGKGCAEQCGGCQDNMTCSADTGYCPGLCRPGLAGPRCDQACGAGWYGPSCQFHCGHCFAGSSCNPVTGICQRGCASGWEGLFCTQECLHHYFGLNCRQRCPHCLTSCEGVTGACDVNGCKVGYTGLMCNQACPSGFYGQDCNSTCGECLTGTCNFISGLCPSTRCTDGWDGPACDQPCGSKRYGVNCTEECGSCKGGETCHHITGDCPTGCEDGYHGDHCQAKTTVLATTSGTSIALVVTILTAGLVVVVMMCVCLALKWRRDKSMFRLVFIRSPLASQ